MAWELISCSSHLSNHYSLDSNKKFDLSDLIRMRQFFIAMHFRKARLHPKMLYSFDRKTYFSITFSRN